MEHLSCFNPTMRYTFYLNSMQLSANSDEDIFWEMMVEIQRDGGCLDTWENHQLPISCSAWRRGPECRVGSAQFILSQSCKLLDSRHSCFTNCTGVWTWEISEEAECLCLLGNWAKNQSKCSTGQMTKRLFWNKSLNFSICENHHHKGPLRAE